MDDAIDEILVEFIQETREHLAEIEPDLLELERHSDQASPEVINRIFRAIHSTKGGASFLSFSALKDFSHAMESVLMRMRDGELNPSSHVVDVLLRAVDVLKSMIDDAQRSELVPCERELAQLNALLKSPAAGAQLDAPLAPAAQHAEVTLQPAAAAASLQCNAQVVPTATTAEPNALLDTTVAPTVLRQPAVTGSPLSAPSSLGVEAKSVVNDRAPTESCELPNVAQDVLREIVATGKLVFCVRARSEHDLRNRGTDAKKLLAAVQSVGFCLAMNPGDPENGEWFEAWCASVLTLDLFATAIGLPGAMIVPIENARVRERIREQTLAPADALPAASEPQPHEPTQVATNAGPPPMETAASTTEAQSGLGAPDVQETLRVRVDLLTRLMNVAGEMVLGRNQLLRMLRDSSDTIPGLGAILQNIDRVTTELHEGVMQTRMQPISVLFTRYTRVVRDVSRQLGKQIEFSTSGKDVELDKSIIEALAEPLTHIIRNSIDHGVESPEERARLGKPSMGNVSVAAFHESGQVNIVVQDDGRGVNRAKVLKKGLDKGLITQAQAASFSDADIMNMLLMPGFSTADRITDISGRGVGMDVVRANVGKLGGHVEIESTEGAGTAVRLRLPLTLAIMPSLIVKVGEARFAVPQVNIVELVWIRGAEVASRIDNIQDAPVLRMRGRLLPLVSIGSLLGLDVSDAVRSVSPQQESASATHVQDSLPGEAADGSTSYRHATDDTKDLSVVVLKSGELRFGVLVDALHEWEEIVVKPLPSYLKDLGCFAGTTILGDGQVIMILDPGGIVKVAQLNPSCADRIEARPAANTQNDEESRSVILFMGAPGELFAIPQEKVLRLERFAAREIERIGTQDFVKYRGRGLPVIRLNSYYPVSAVPSEADEVFLVIPRAEGASRTAEPTGGILVWKILDALDVVVHLGRPMFKGPGVKGATIIDGTLTTFMDPAELVSTVNCEQGAA